MFEGLDWRMLYFGDGGLGRRVKYTWEVTSLGCQRWLMKLIESAFRHGKAGEFCGVVESEGWLRVVSLAWVPEV